MTGRFDGKVTLVTGAGSGIGRAVAHGFAREGATVVAADIIGERAEETAQAIRAGGGAAHGMRCDVGDEMSVQALVADAIARFEVIDYAVNNAGISHDAAPTADLSLSDWENCLRVNVTGVWLCMREELRHMAPRRQGAIVNTASFSGYHTLNGMSAYVASKHAVIGLTKNAAIEYGAQGIRINGISPGAVPTGMFDKNLAGMDAAAREEVIRSIAALHPMQRIAEIDEIAAAVLFLCSDAASFITGALLPVDGGWGAI